MSTKVCFMEALAAARKGKTIRSVVWNDSRTDMRIHENRFWIFFEGRRVCLWDFNPGLKINILDKWEII